MNVVFIINWSGSGQIGVFVTDTLWSCQPRLYTSNTCTCSLAVRCFAITYAARVNRRTCTRVKICLMRLIRDVLFSKMGPAQSKSTIIGADYLSIGQPVCPKLCIRFKTYKSRFGPVFCVPTLVFRGRNLHEKTHNRLCLYNPPVQNITHTRICRTSNEVMRTAQDTPARQVVDKNRTRQ